MDTVDRQLPTVELPQIDTQLGEARPADQREMSPRGRSRARRESREQMFFESQIRFASPEARFVCNGWCEYSEEPHPNVVSIEHLSVGEQWASYMSPALSIRLLGLATRMGRPKRLANYGVVQLS
jgi:hypothetical protein